MTELIKTAGANVSPAEVRAALVELAGVQEAYILPIPDPDRGQLVAAAVVAEEGRSVDPDSLRAQLRKNLSPFKIPVAIAVFRDDEIPRTGTFKVRRHDLTRMIQERCS
jgi:acyl-CoA synthetase (AMP-forming)/AMP-acid ligase II